MENGSNATASTDVSNIYRDTCMCVRVFVHGCKRCRVDRLHNVTTPPSSSCPKRDTCRSEWMLSGIGTVSNLERTSREYGVLCMHAIVHKSRNAWYTYDRHKFLHLTFISSFELHECNDIRISIISSVFRIVLSAKKFILLACGNKIVQLFIQRCIILRLPDVRGWIKLG